MLVKNALCGGTCDSLNVKGANCVDKGVAAAVTAAVGEGMMSALLSWMPSPALQTHQLHAAAGEAHPQ